MPPTVRYALVILIANPQQIEEFIQPGKVVRKDGRDCPLDLLFLDSVSYPRIGLRRQYSLVDSVCQLKRRRIEEIVEGAPSAVISPLGVERVGFCLANSRRVLQERSEIGLVVEGAPTAFFEYGVK